MKGELVVSTKEAWMGVCKLDRSPKALLLSLWSCREGRLYLPWLMKQIQALGGTFERRRISSLSELKGYDAIVNCTGGLVQEIIFLSILKY